MLLCKSPLPRGLEISSNTCDSDRLVFDVFVIRWYHKVEFIFHCDRLYAYQEVHVPTWIVIPSFSRPRALVKNNDRTSHFLLAPLCGLLWEEEETDQYSCMELLHHAVPTNPLKNHIDVDRCFPESNIQGSFLIPAKWPQSVFPDIISAC